MGGQRGEAEATYDLGEMLFLIYFFLLLFVPGRTADTPRSLALPFFLGASDLLRARCLLCNCRDWMRSKVARVAQVMEPVGGQRQGREGAKWRGIALCCANKSQERCFYIKRRLICLFTCSVCLSVAFVLFTVCYLTKCGCFFVFFFYEHTLKLMGKKVCCIKKRKDAPQWQTGGSWITQLRVCLFESLEIPSYKLRWQTSLTANSGQSFVFLSALTTWQILLMLHPCNCSSREQGTRCATSAVRRE